MATQVVAIVAEDAAIGEETRPHEAAQCMHESSHRSEGGRTGSAPRQRGPRAERPGRKRRQRRMAAEVRRLEATVQPQLLGKPAAEVDQRRVVERVAGHEDVLEQPRLGPLHPGEDVSIPGEPAAARRTGLPPPRRAPARTTLGAPAQLVGEARRQERLEEIVGEARRRRGMPAGEVLLRWRPGRPQPRRTASPARPISAEASPRRSRRLWATRRCACRQRGGAPP